MKIAIITSGRLPVPATRGGAVETKLDYMMDYNATHHLHDITVYSIKPDFYINKNTKENHYVHLRFDSFWARICKYIFKKYNKTQYYTTEMEYFLYKCIQDIKRKQFDCIIIANRPGFILKLREAFNICIVNQINNDYINPDSLLAGRIKEASSVIITCSNYLNKRVQEVECIKEPPIITVHNGIDIKRFSEAQPIKRMKLGVAKDDFVVFYSGRLTKEKGILELIRAIKQINSIPNIKLIIAGASFYGKDSKETIYTKILQEEAKDIKESVYFTGFIDYKEMPSYLKTANVVVVPSLWEEPFGLTVLEAMAAGVPLIATRCGGIPEVCDNTAFLIERENLATNLVTAIQYIYKHPQEALLLAQKAQKRSWLFDKDTFSKNYFEVIKLTCDKNAK